MVSLVKRVKEKYHTLLGVKKKKDKGEYSIAYVRMGAEEKGGGKKKERKSSKTGCFSKF